ncbi:GntR family transcriptional regulator [Leifsonia poae]|uniref:GntR family transcriptional regulator n=1 Tax=Leifsonia poae TaxID=110933 RepID=UPI001CC0DE25|nr:GntR family transcriptional regulator [Leifsonia poae]
MIFDDAHPITARPLRSTALSVDRRLLRNDVYEVLLERILVGALAPGARLKDAELTSWLRVSRTPVREALSRLAMVGLVTTAPNRFTLVAPLDLTEVGDAVTILRQLAPDAVDAVLRDATADDDLDFDLLGARLERDPRPDPVEMFRRVLSLVLATLRNRILAETLESVQLRVLRYLNLCPGAASAVHIDGLTAFTRALSAHDARAPGLMLAMLDEIAARVTDDAAAKPDSVVIAG